MPDNKKTTNTFIYFAGILSLGLVISIIGPSLPTLAKHTGIDLYKMGLIFPAISIGYLIGAFSSGMIYDRIKGHPILAISLMIFSSLLFIIPTVKNLYILMQNFILEI